MHVQPVDYIFMCKHSNPPSNNVLYVCYLIFFFRGSRNRTTCSDSSCKSYNTFQRHENFFFRCRVVYLYVGQGRNLLCTPPSPFSTARCRLLLRVLRVRTTHILDNEKHTDPSFILLVIRGQGGEEIAPNFLHGTRGR